MANNPGRKHGKWRDNTNQLGEYIKNAMDAYGLEAQRVYGMLGLRCEQFYTLMTSRNQKFYFPWVFRLSEIPGISTIKLLLLLYRDQAIADDFSEEEQRMQMQLLLLFDRFYRLRDDDQDFAVKMIEDLVRNRGEKPLSDSQEEFINNLRMSPSYGSGNGAKEMENRIREYGPDSGGTKSGSDFLEGTPSVCPNCGGTTFYLDGKVKRKKQVVQRYSCKSCGKYVAGEVVEKPVLVE